MFQFSFSRYNIYNTLLNTIPLFYPIFTIPWIVVLLYPLLQGLVNVPIEHHPTIGAIISNRYLKVMFEIPKKGHQSQPLYFSQVLVSFVLMVFVEEGDRVDANVDADAGAAALSELPRHHSTASAVQEDQVGVPEMSLRNGAFEVGFQGI